MVSEKGLMIVCVLIALVLLYWLGLAWSAHREKRKRFDQHNNLTARYIELEQRVETIQVKMKTYNDRRASVSFCLKACVSAYILMGIVLYRMGPTYMAHIVSEMPHVVVTLPLALFIIL